MFTAVGETVVLPEVFWLPLQPFEALQLTAFGADQVRVALDPGVITVGEAEKVTGDDTLLTATVTDWVTVPPLPEQVKIYVVFEVGVTLCDPEAVLDPVHPPLAVQLVVLVANHERVEELPEVIDAGFAEKVIVGGSTTYLSKKSSTLQPSGELV